MTVDRTILVDPTIYGTAVPFEEFARRRREEPVGWVDELPLRPDETVDGARNRGFWAVTTHAEVSAASKAPEIFSSAARGAFLFEPPTQKRLERMRGAIINMDAPEHTRMRRYVRDAFTPRAVRKLSENIRASAETLVKNVTTMGEFDGVDDLAAELPLIVLSDLLGVPRADRHLMLRWSNAIVGVDDPDYGKAGAFGEAFREGIAYGLALAAERRKQPRDDLMTLLATTKIDGQGLTEVEFSQMWMFLVGAGNETTRHLLSGGLLAFTQWPGERDRFLADPSMTPSAVEEFLRWVTPIVQFRRTATRDTELGGQTIRAGEKVVLYYTSANRDEKVFEQPDRLNLSRRPNPHVGFGVGPHICLGAYLARLEAVALLDVMRPHLAAMEQAGPVVRMESNFVNGLKSLPLRFR